MTPASSHAVEISGLTKHFGGTRRQVSAGVDGPTLQDIDLTVAPGECLALTGASGCGKTTLLRLLAGLEQPTAGTIRLFGETPAEACRQPRIGVAFQHPALVPSRTALENVRLTLEVVGAGRRNTSSNPAQLLVDFGLGKFLHHYPHQLSGGMRQRVNIACALVHAPRLLLLDEPFGALDELTRASLLDWLADILQRTGQTALLVTHNLEEAVCLADRIVILGHRPGRIAEELPVRLPRPRTEAFRATTDFLRMVAATRQTLRRVTVGDTAADPRSVAVRAEPAIATAHELAVHPLEADCLALPAP
jgi:NitT/TauT family transport system ATP-binding protein